MSRTHYGAGAALPQASARVVCATGASGRRPASFLVLWTDEHRTLRGDGYGEQIFEIDVALDDLDGTRPRWSTESKIASSSP